MDYVEFIGKMVKIKEMGYVPSHREGDTGIGKTLEDLLGIAENNISGPDFSNYELKAARKNSVSMLTLFTKAPQPANANKELLEKCGYPSRKQILHSSLRDSSQNKLTDYTPRIYSTNSAEKAEDKELHITVDALSWNSCKLKLSVRADRLYIDNDKNVEAYYDNETLKDCFEKKYHTLIYILADHKGTRNNESFWFNEGYLLDGFSFQRFSELIAEGKLKVDIRIGHYKDGRLHDHGTGFRILPKYLPQCFKTINKIL
jgi:hypothetical protein